MLQATDKPQENFINAKREISAGRVKNGLFSSCFQKSFLALGRSKI